MLACCEKKKCFRDHEKLLRLKAQNLNFFEITRTIHLNIEMSLIICYFRTTKTGNVEVKSLINVTVKPIQKVKNSHGSHEHSLGDRVNYPQQGYNMKISLTFEDQELKC